MLCVVYYIISIMSINKGLIDGCFDYFHYGHIYAIFQSKQLCDTLHLVIHSDEEILNAKGYKPILDFKYRLQILGQCKFIDTLHTNSSTSIEFLDKFKCDRVNLYDRNICVSTSNVIKRLYNFINNGLIITNTNFKYLTMLYNKLQIYNNVNLNIKFDKIIFLNCEFDLFTNHHIEILNDIRKKYDSTYTIFIDLILYNDKKLIFNKYESRVFLAGIEHIYDILINIPDKKINCNELILINTYLAEPFNFNICKIDTTFTNNINKIPNLKKDIINNINFNLYKGKLNKNNL